MDVLGKGGSPRERHVLKVSKSHSLIDPIVGAMLSLARAARKQALGGGILWPDVPLANSTLADRNGMPGADVY